MRDGGHKTIYMEHCGMTNKPYRETELTLKNILSKHDTLDANRLSREGFLSYYREVAATDPRQVTCSLFHVAYVHLDRDLNICMSMVLLLLLLLVLCCRCCCWW